jgi:hypothetical protein
MNQARYGLQGKARGGNGKERENGSMNLMSHIRHNKIGHMFRYNSLQGIPQDTKGGITYVPISILSDYEKL